MTTPARHSERCRECKVRVHQLLEAIYGRCIPNHRFNWPTSISSYIGTPVHDQLRSVVAAIEAHRGYRTSDFVRISRLAPCDYWIPDPGFVLEFDESQHFTAPRSTRAWRVCGSPSVGILIGSLDRAVPTPQRIRQRSALPGRTTGVVRHLAGSLADRSWSPANRKSVCPRLGMVRSRPNARVGSRTLR